MIRAYRKGLNAAQFFMPVGPATSQFGPPTAGEASEWMTRDISVIAATLSVGEALTGSETRNLRYFNNNIQTGSTLTLQDAASVAGLIGALLPAAQNAGFAESDVARSADSGSPPTEDMIITTFMRDVDDETLSWQGFGSGTFNHAVTGTPEYFGAETTRTTLTESQARCIVASAGVFRHFTGRYGTTGSDFQLDFMLNGVATLIGALPDDSSERFLFENVNIAVAAGDEWSIRVTRTAGSSSAFVICGYFAFAPELP